MVHISTKLQKLCNVENISYVSYREAVNVWIDKDVSEATRSAQGMQKEQHEKVSQDNSDVHNVILYCFPLDGDVILLPSS